jgi:hypothetical protein
MMASKHKWMSPHTHIYTQTTLIQSLVKTKRHTFQLVLVRALVQKRHAYSIVVNLHPPLPGRAQHEEDAFDEAIVQLSAHLCAQQMPEGRSRKFGAACALLLKQCAKHGKPLVVVGALGLVDCDNGSQWRNDESQSFNDACVQRYARRSGDPDLKLSRVDSLTLFGILGM